MNKRTYYKKLNNYINKNIDKKIQGKIVYHDLCKKCKSKGQNCGIECNGMTEHFNFQFQNREFNIFIRRVLGNNIDLDISEKGINNKLIHNVFKYKDKYLKIVYKEDYIKVKNKVKISQFDYDYDNELVGMFEIKDRGWRL